MYFFVIILRRPKQPRNAARKRSRAREKFAKFRQKSRFFAKSPESSFVFRARVSNITSGQVLVHVKHVPNSYYEGRNNRETPRTKDLARARKVCKISTKIAIFRELARIFVCFSRTCFAQAGKCWCMLSTPQTLTTKAETTAKRRAREISRARKVCSKRAYSF